jgi:uncharacterized iron-regulated protein
VIARFPRASSLSRGQLFPRTFGLLLALACLAIPACALFHGSGNGNPSNESDEARSPLEAPPLAEMVRIFDAKSGERLDLDELLDQLAGKEAVFLGETHLDETTHRVELAVLEGLIRRKNGKVALAMEMFERDVQPSLDRYLAGEITEAEFLANSRPWGNYRTGYRPLIEAARASGVAVLAANPPAEIRRKLAFAGPDGLENLTPEERALLPEELLPNSDEYWERFARVVRGHMGMVFLQSPERRITSSQSLWDNSMGETVARSLERNPDVLVLHVNGGFHSAYRDGAVHQLLSRRPDTDVAVVDMTPVNDLAGIEAPDASDSHEGDYLVYAMARARGLSDGFHAVTIFPELRYRLHFPTGTSGADPVPFLIWLPDDGLRAEDGMALWKSAIGDEAAIAVIETLHPQTEADLRIGGRWYWKETFNEDLSTLQSGIEDVLSYVARHFPIRTDSVVVAGEGTGATVVAASSLYSAVLSVPLIAAAPRRYAAIREMSLPLEIPNLAGESGLAGKRLTVMTGPDDEDWWKEELEDYRGANLEGEVVPLSDSAWDRFHEVEAAVRKRLGLEPAAPPESDAEATMLVLASEEATARVWARRIGRRMEANGARVAVVTADEARSLLESEPDVSWTVRPLAFDGETIDLDELPGNAEISEPYRAEDLSGGQYLPLAPGAFGGTTIVILPEGMDEDEITAWSELASSGAIRHRSRFASMRVVRDAEDGALAAALAEIVDSGRTSVAIVPAVFYAGPETMWKWSRQAEPYRDALDIAWMPGLGGRLYLMD